MDNSFINPPEDWLTTELFDYCILMHIIAPEEEFEDWKHDRPELLRLVKENIDEFEI